MPAIPASLRQVIPFFLIKLSLSLRNRECASTVLAGSVLKHFFTEAVAVVTVDEWFCFFYVFQIVGVQHIFSAPFAVMDSPFFQTLRAYMGLHAVCRPGFSAEAACF